MDHRVGKVLLRKHDLSLNPQHTSEDRYSSAQLQPQLCWGQRQVYPRGSLASQSSCKGEF